jgi:hypothetical protein
MNDHSTDTMHVNSNGIASSQLWSQVEMLDQQITNEVLCILGKMSSGISEVVENVRNGIYRWLLVLDVVNLKARVDKLRQEPVAEVATVLLSAYLINELSNPAAIERRIMRESLTPGELLSTCKKLFTILQLDRKERLETIQSGILLSALELNDGRFHEASLTITICAKVASELRLHSLDHLFPETPCRLDVDDITKRRIWCGILTLDR